MGTICADSHDRPTCAQCRFFRPKGEKCQRYPPAVIYDIAAVDRVIMFPRVSSAMWCGEFQSRTPLNAGSPGPGMTLKNPSHQDQDQ